MIEMRIVGMDDAKTFLNRLQQAIIEATGIDIKISSGLAYSYGIEHGYHRSGRRARLAGGAFYMRGARDRVRRDMPGRMARALLRGPDGVRREARAIGDDAVTEARSLVPVVSGDLSRSIAVGGGGGFSGGGRSIRNAFRRR